MALTGGAMNLQDRYDDAMFDYSRAEFAAAIATLKEILAADPEHFDAQLALAMCHYRLGDYPTAIAEGHRAEKLRPNEQLVHTNLSLFYMKSGDKSTAEHHGLQARIASWRGNMAPPSATDAAATQDDPELRLAGQPKPGAAPAQPRAPLKMPEQPWKKKPAG